MAEFIEALADELVASGVGTGRYSTSGVSVQLNHRRDLGAPHVIQVRQAGGLPFPYAGKEQQGVQILVDSEDVVSGQTIARQAYDQLHNRTAEVIGGHNVLWMRASTLPQPLPGPAGQAERFTFVVSLEALLRLTGGE